MWTKCYHFFVGWLYRFRHSAYKTKIVRELPRRLHSKIFYIVKDDSFLEQATMICPCGCLQVLHMNLLPDERPCWKVDLHSYEISSLHPSVWRQVGCKSHFWFKNGQVEFCKVPTG